MKLKHPRKKAVPTPAPVVLPDPATLGLVLYPHPVLKKIAKPVEKFDPWLHALVERMKDLMVEHKGVGLAAPQVGVGLRVFVASPTGGREEAVAYINPIISEETGKEEGEEGCLSLPEIRIQVLRCAALRIDAQDAQGKAFSRTLAEFPARVVQHENDHLDGILLLDRMGPVARLANRKKIKELEEKAKGPKT